MSSSIPADVNGEQSASAAAPVTASESPVAAKEPRPENGTPTQPSENAGKKQSKKEKQQPQTATTEQDVAEAGAGAKLTGAQLKKQKAAEKAARRAEKVAIKGEQAQVQAQAGKENVQQKKKDGGDQSQQQSQSTQGQHQRRKSMNQPLEPGVVRLPFRPGQPTPATSQSQTQAQPKPSEKKVPMVAHLYPSARPASLTTASREIHPSVLTLGLHLRSLVLAGSTARTLALVITLKRVIRAYTTPPNTALSRHLTTHISHQISFLSSARPLGIAQGNAIRWLKTLISKLDPDLDENDAKRHICDAIDGFVIEKITYASEVISDQASARIADRDETILVYAKSSVVEKTLLKAAREQNKRFKVIVVDSRPLFEGRNLAKGLLRAGMREGGDLHGCEVIYTLISGLADVLEQHSVTKCFLGASAMLGNGSLYSRCGTAMVATMAKHYKIPVLVLSESLKFTARMAVDSLSLNELGDANALVETEESSTFTDLSPPKTEDTNKKGGGGGGKKKDDEGKENEDEANKGSILRSWQDQPNLYLLNLMYDVTPKEYLDMVICELGTLPPGAVPVVNGVHGGEE